MTARVRKNGGPIVPLQALTLVLKKEGLESNRAVMDVTMRIFIFDFIPQLNEVRDYYSEFHYMAELSEGIQFDNLINIDQAKATAIFIDSLLPRIIRKQRNP